MTQVRKKRPAAPRRAPQVARRPASPKQAAARRRPIDDLLNPELFKALSDPTRLRIAACLAKCARPCAVSEIAACCDVDLSVVSRHLKALERADLLESVKRGRTVTYAVRYEHFCRTLRALADAIEQCCPEGCAGPAPCAASCGREPIGSRRAAR